MLNTQKIQSETLAYWVLVLLVVLLAGRYGRQAIEWLLLKLYDFFITGAR